MSEGFARLLRGARSLALGYALLLGALWLFQRSILYVPTGEAIAPAVVGVRAEALDVPTTDGERIRLWWAPPEPGRAILVHFHGNGGNQAMRAEVFRDVIAAGNGLVSVSWRGYPGSTGRPSEAGLIADARAALAFARQREPSAPVALFGESLGSGVAVLLAAEARVEGVVLNAPYTAVEDVASEVYWFVPARLLIADRFRSRDAIDRIGAPLLIVHGTADGVIPFAHGERLFAMAREPKRFLRIEGGGHNDLWNRGARAATLTLLDDIARR